MRILLVGFKELVPVISVGRLVTILERFEFGDLGFDLLLKVRDLRSSLRFLILVLRNPSVLIDFGTLRFLLFWLVGRSPGVVVNL